MQFDNLDTAAFSNLDVYVELHTVSKDHYLYQQTLQLYRSSSNSKSSEPVHVYNNINNGYGIFAGEDFQSVKFTVK
jgi:hypothetical protein